MGAGFAEENGNPEINIEMKNAKWMAEEMVLVSGGVLTIGIDPEEAARVAGRTMALVKKSGLRMQCLSLNQIECLYFCLTPRGLQRGMEEFRIADILNFRKRLDEGNH